MFGRRKASKILTSRENLEGFQKVGAAARRGALVHGLTQSVLFEFYAPYADTVTVAGSFNRWNPTLHPLRKEGGGKWRLSLDLPLGRHEYRYVVDEEWANEQRPMEAAPNPYGGYNNVVQLS